MGTDFLEKIEKLPYDKKKEVEDFVDFLIAKTTNDIKNNLTIEIKPGFGGGKGIFGKMADDFDEPLDEMKDYM
jgi:hypothetical protein